jgi:hypothetical protein
MGLEPTTSCVTGRRSNQLNYRTKDMKYKNNLYTESITTEKILADNRSPPVIFLGSDNTGKAGIEAQNGFTPLIFNLFLQ